ncbi:MAG: cation-translocating P-type ATPase [Candidatus Paceibacterota bacterium]
MNPENSRWSDFEDKFFLVFDILLIALTVIFLGMSFFLHETWSNLFLAGVSFLGLLPVAWSALKSLFKRQVSVDLLASIALIFSLLSKEWFSASFITLMLAFARIFDHITEARTKKTIQSLMKYHVEWVRVQIGETVKDIHIKEVKPGDLVIVNAGDRMPVDGIIQSGLADVDESSLTGESELVSKRPGDKVFTSTVNESGSLIVKAEKVGADTTLAHIITLVEEASRNKSQAERTANTFTKWYIGLALLSTVTMYLLGLDMKVILAVLLVVCADDIAVAVPLAFTAAISRTAKRGVIVKGSAAYEQLSRMKYVLTDKTGTLTKGRPKVVDLKAYGKYSKEKVLELFGMGTSESKHAVSKAIADYLKDKNVKVHAPHESKEISGQGVSFSHDNDKMFIGRLSFLEKENIPVADEIKKDIDMEKDSGRGIVVLSINGETAGLVSYVDELRPRMKEIIDETKILGVKEWHMLTGDNEKTARMVASELGLTHPHANMTPESKVEFVRKFQKERKKGEIVAYIGDGVNDAASLALADVSIAMGGIGSDAAIEASDITIMHDHLDRLPIIMKTAQNVKNIMWQCFAIWAITNIIGLGLVSFGLIGPAGAAAYNFITDFIPIGNALRAGRIKNS